MLGVLFFSSAHLKSFVFLKYILASWTRNSRRLWSTRHSGSTTARRTSEAASTWRGIPLWSERRKSIWSCGDTERKVSTPLHTQEIQSEDSSSWKEKCFHLGFSSCLRCRLSVLTVLMWSAEPWRKLVGETSRLFSPVLQWIQIALCHRFSKCSDLLLKILRDNIFGAGRLQVQFLCGKLPVWVLFRYSNLILPFKDVSWIGNSNLPCDELATYPQCSPLSPYDSWVRFQHHHDAECTLG